MRRRDGRHQTDALGPRRQPRRDECGVEPTPQRRGPGGLQREGVVDHDEVERPALGGVDEVLEPLGVEQALGLGAVRAPGGGVGAGVAEVDAEVQGPGEDVGRAMEGSVHESRRRARTGCDGRCVGCVRGRARETAGPSIAGLVRGRSGQGACQRQQVLSAPEPAPGQQEDRRERPPGTAAGCPSVLIVRPFVPAWRALRRCRARAWCSCRTRSSPGAPHTQEGCHPASRGLSLEFMT